MEMLFIAYLWGIETDEALGSKATIILFIAYLWGIETSRSNG